MRIPMGFNTVSAYFLANQADESLSLLFHRLAGTQVLCHMNGDRIAADQFLIGNAKAMVSEATQSLPAMPALHYLYVSDAYAVMSNAWAAGATKNMDVADMLHWDRQGGIKNPCGNLWWLSQSLVGGAYEWSLISRSRRRRSAPTTQIRGDQNRQHSSH